MCALMSSSREVSSLSVAHSRVTFYRCNSKSKLGREKLTRAKHPSIKTSFDTRTRAHAKEFGEYHFFLLSATGRRVSRSKRRWHDRAHARARISARPDRRPERPDVVLAVRFINEFTRLNHRLKNVYEVTVRYLSNNHVRG